MGVYSAVIENAIPDAHGMEGFPYSLAVKGIKMRRARYMLYSFR
jgi:hypothetical protein